MRDHAHRIEVEHRIVKRFLLHILLRDQDNFIVMVFCKFKGAKRHLATHQNASRRERKYNSVPQREQRIRFIKVKSHAIKLVNPAKNLRGVEIVFAKFYFFSKPRRPKLFLYKGFPLPSRS